MKVGLIGNPNVGKSVIFHQLTGVGVEVSNYPGTTINRQAGTTCFQRAIIEFIDLPGTYSLEGDSEEEKIVRSFIDSDEAEVIVAVLDAGRLERNLYLTLQIAEYQKPMIVVLNMMDEAEKAGIHVDTEQLSSILGVEVIPTVATQGKNTGSIIPAVINAARVPEVKVLYDHHIEAAIKTLRTVHALTWIRAIHALQGHSDEPDLREAASALSDEIERMHRMKVSQIIAGNRHHCAEHIAQEVLQFRSPERGADIDRLLTSRIPGIPLLAAILIGILLTVFIIGSWLEEGIVTLITRFVMEPFLAAGLPPLAEQVGVSLILAIQAGFGIAFPFIFTFYLFIALLEDSGYLTRAAFLADRTLHRFGMHGTGIIPLVLGFGCNVPAIMSIKLLRTKRERLIASFLVTLVPCSARTVIIAGLVAAFIGLAAAMSVYFLVIAIVLATGLLLSRVTPGDQYGMILEMSPLRWPTMKNVLLKSWMRIREFLLVAMPLLIIASIILGLFQYFGFMAAFEAFIAPFSETVLGLPAYATTALIFGILRKEMALETLIILAGTADLGSVLSMAQIYIFAVVSVLFVPCIATIAVLRKEVGTRMAIVIAAYTLALGLLAGAVLNILLS
ncbi:MAG: ferrous iron transport protein B [Methanomicrobiales archaeon]|jgi:ferrous iron transport protein B|nr:ferrous iron transport protein B [Methanoregulaceae archaeon]HNW80753.1 ferrous iron transport protein B [Methanoregulaceae archaeon]HPA07573.1 ferrous iron transport protein B [Methanoregulaceae archaeon]HPS23516.1 ferrous iron transport protein B [Methanoregulaceae archaeon]HQN89418.1 ferrous iron transport protein B [Methanoregulaceae archaeon]